MKKSFLHFSVAILFFTSIQSFAQSVGCNGGNCVNGIGTYVWDTKQEYTGEWVNGARTGLGVYDWPDGSYYYGYFLNGVLEGRGVYLGNDEAKTTFVGTFHNGTLATTENFIATGCMLGSCYEGIGVYLWDNNDMYIGEWTDGKRTGYGRFDWADGSFYTGYFKDGKLDGLGYYSSADGKVMDGTFVDNSFTGAVKSAAASSTLPVQPKPVSKATISGTYYSACSVLQKVIEGYPGDFVAIQGDLDSEASVLLKVWNSTVKYDYINEPQLNGGLISADVPFTWSQEIYSATDFKTAKAKYTSLITEFNSCSCSCCAFTSSETTSTKYDDVYTTAFDVSKVNPGFSDDYSDMEVNIELKEDSYAKTWNITIEVMNSSNY